MTMRSWKGAGAASAQTAELGFVFRPPTEDSEAPPVSKLKF